VVRVRFHDRLPAHRVEAVLVIETGEVFAGELGQFLRLMDQTYFGASRFYRGTETQILPNTWDFTEDQWVVAERDFQRLWDSLPKIASDYPKYTTDHSFTMGRESFRILRIRMGSIELLLQGLMWPLLAAAIFSGCKIIRKPDGTIEFHLRALGVGIRELLKASNPNRKNIPRPPRMRDRIDEP
jgi:hypothetical protein